MRLMDGLFLTLISTVICLAFPKLLSMVLAVKNKPTASLPTVTRTQEINTEVASSL
ncbi:hypothetical protein [Fischerella sp. JS2]|uniref:hypothetical protein n=1 Tax=Fischerella sp. JS2 TaxID=2597771 RepID=UPI0028F16FD1|nr:hypothetical protein [Fischerella sp. JS2]